MTKYELDRQSLAKAKDFYASGAYRQLDAGTVAALLAIHGHIFNGLYPFAEKCAN